jgi:ABC-type hemin transport system ATPase subunit
LITGETAASSIRVKTRLTARRLGYELVDHTDNQAVPVLNQAGMNALSLSLLFAQAEAWADDDGLHYIVLDDPIQSLDAEHQGGLARAIEALPSHWGVMLGVVASPLVERLKEYVSVPRQIITLGPYSRETGSQIASQESL